MTWWEDTSSQQDNIHLAWLACSVSNKHETCGRSSNDRNDTCAIVHKTWCVSMMDVYIVDTTCTHKEGPCAWLEYGCKHGIVTNMLKYVHWTVKRGGCKDSTRAHGMSSSTCKHQGETQGRLWNWMHTKILEGVETATTLGNALVEFQLLCFGPLIA